MLTKGWGSAVAGGAALLTAANLAYYAAGGTAPGAGTWLVLGVTGGLSFGAAGRLFRLGPEPARLVAALMLAGVLIAEGAEVFTAEGEVDDGVELVLGCALPVLAARSTRYRATAAAATAALLAIAATGALEPLVP